MDELYKIEEEKTEKLRESGFSERVIFLTNACGGIPEILLKVKRILDKDMFSDEDIAFLIMHYTDAYTMGSSWAESVSSSGENELERRMFKNKKNKKYTKLEKELLAVRDPCESLFFEKTLSMVMTELGHEIERRFARIIAEKTGKQIEPVRLPEIIDEEIKDRIMRFS